MRKSPPVALTIAGLDPSCGAGITADLKTFAAYGLFGICCATALTVQSTQGVRRSIPIDGSIVRETLECLFDDAAPAGIKVGMLGTADIVHTLSAMLDERKYPRSRVVLDPVLRASSGASLLDSHGVKTLREVLLTHVGWITPNIEELAILLDEPLADRAGVPAQARRLQALGRSLGNPDLRVVVTGGHLEEPDDYFVDAVAGIEEAEPGEWLRGKRIETSATHGTGCAFSSALLCGLIEDGEPEHSRRAVLLAKAFVTAALENAYPVGHGKGPLNHLYRL